MVLNMKIAQKIFVFTVIFELVATAMAFAQNSKIRYADEQMGLLKYQQAIQLYQEAFVKKPTFETAQKLANAYDLVRDNPNAYSWWKITADFDIASAEDYGRFLHAAQLVDKTDEATQVLKAKGVALETVKVEHFLPPSNNPKIKLQGVKEINSEASDFLITQDTFGNKYFVSDRGESFYSKMPAIRIDGRNKIFSDDRSDITARNYFSVYKLDPTGQVTKLVSDVSQVYNFSDPSFAPQKGILFYSVTRGFTKVKKNRDIVVQPEIFFSKLLPNGTLEGFTPLPFNDSIAYSVMNPFVDEDANRLYFTSDMPGGLGGYDLYYAHFDDNMVFGNPVNLGPVINTTGDESHAFRKEGKFYFSSTGHKGLGGMDVFVANYNPMEFTNVQNLGTPINSHADDFGYRELAKNQIYISSNRSAGQGLDDVYSLQENYKQFLAKVLDCEGKIVKADFDLVFREIPEKTDVKTYRTLLGELASELELEKNYELTISKQGFFSVSDHSISTKGMEIDTLKRTYNLMPIPYQLPLYNDLIYYDLDKFVIREDAKPTLDKLAKIMIKYDFLNLLIASYTDSRASEAYNIALSENRAKAVTEFLSRYQIKADRVRMEWFGEKNLVNDCGDGVPCPDSMHQLNRRSELILEAFPDPQKNYKMPDQLKGLDFCNPKLIIQNLSEEIKLLK